jgi:hypothetical protein
MVVSSEVVPGKVTVTNGNGVNFCGSVSGKLVSSAVAGVSNTGGRVGAVEDNSGDESMPGQVQASSRSMGSRDRQMRIAGFIVYAW